MGRREEQRHLRRVAVRDQRRLLRAGRVHHGSDVLHPVLRCDGLLGHAVGEADAAHVEPEHPREARQPVDELLDEALLPDHLEMARPVEDEDDVARPFADDLVGEVDVAAAGIQRAWPGHGTVVSQFDGDLCPR
jgi:hypothetical protein